MFPRTRKSTRQTHDINRNIKKYMCDLLFIFQLTKLLRSIFTLFHCVNNAIYTFASNECMC